MMISNNDKIHNYYEKMKAFFTDNMGKKVRLVLNKDDIYQQFNTASRVKQTTGTVVKVLNNHVILQLHNSYIFSIDDYKVFLLKDIDKYFVHIDKEIEKRKIKRELKRKLDKEFKK